MITILLPQYSGKKEEVSGIIFILNTDIYLYTRENDSIEIQLNFFTPVSLTISSNNFKHLISKGY